VHAHVAQWWRFADQAPITIGGARCRSQDGTWIMIAA
jgi:hypothetical protein